MPYQYKWRGYPAQGAHYRRKDYLQHIPAKQESLTGNIGGMKASDIEERFHRAMTRLEIQADFRVRISPPMLNGVRGIEKKWSNMKGEIEIDFLADHGRTIPIFIDGEIAHFFTPSQADSDRDKANITNEFGKSYNWADAVRIPFWKLTDQDMADRTAREVFGV